MLNNGLLSFGYIFLLFFCFIFFFFVFFVFFRVDKLCSEEEQVNQQMGRNVTDAVRLYFRFVYWMYTLIVFAFAGGQMQWLSPSESGGRYFALVDFFFIALLKWKGALVSVLLNAHMVHTKFIMRGMECMGYNMIPTVGGNNSFGQGSGQWLPKWRHCFRHILFFVLMVECQWWRGMTCTIPEEMSSIV